MRSQAGLAALALISVLSITTAQALPRQPSDWLKCDGQPKPGAGGRRAAAALGTLATLGVSDLFYRRPEAPLSKPAASGLAGVEACDAVLGDDAVASDWARRAQLLRYRAQHNLVAGNANAALIDIERMREVAGGQSSERSFARSIGAAASLVEATALTRLGRFEEAEAALVKGLAGRKYSPSVLRLAYLLLYIDPEARSGEIELLQRFASLTPGARAIYAAALDSKGDLDAAADAWAQLANNPSLDSVTRTRHPVVQDLMPAALAAARAGRADDARALVAQARKAADDELSSGVETALKSSQLVKERGDWVEAILLGRAGDSEGANALVEDADLSVDFVPALVEILEKRRVRPKSREKIVDALRAKRSALIDGQSFLLALPDFEPGRPDTSSTQPIYKTSGFSQKPSEFGGLVLTYAGANLPLPTAEEALYLWAAELAKAANKTGFNVERWSALDQSDPKVRAELARYPLLSTDFIITSLTITLANEPQNGMPFINGSDVRKELSAALGPAVAN